LRYRKLTAIMRADKKMDIFKKL